MNAHVEGRMHGGGLAPLSGQQIRELVLLARRAYALEFPAPEMDFDAWRHWQCQVSVERPGLTACRQDEFLPLRAHFLRMCGLTEAAKSDDFRALNEPRTRAAHALHEACREYADVLPRAMDYAAGFIRNKRHVDPDDADAKTLWHAVYVVRRRGEQLRRKVAA